MSLQWLVYIVNTWPISNLSAVSSLSSVIIWAGVVLTRIHNHVQFGVFYLAKPDCGCLKRVKSSSATLSWLPFLRYVLDVKKQEMILSR